MAYKQSQETASIVTATSTTVSTAVYLGDKLPVALQMPASLTSTAVTFQGSWDGTTYQAVNSGGSAYSETVAAAKNVVLDPTKFKGFRYLKLIMGSAEGADRAIGVMLRREI